MFENSNQRNIKIISEIHPQHHGSMNEIKRMILQNKIGGADYVKVQLYNSQELFNNKDREYLDISKEELFEIYNYGKTIGVEVFASIFDEERVDWCEEIGINLYKIASRSVDDKKLCEKIISTNKPVIISLGMYDYKNKDLPYKSSNLIYLYCVSKYPTALKDLEMPDFNNSFFSGFSDHTVGIGACLYAISRGAKYIEKHYSNNKSMNVDTQMAHVCSMDSQDLSKLRELSDTFTLINSYHKK